jgi:hypothetical protein
LNGLQMEILAKSSTLLSTIVQGKSFHNHPYYWQLYKENSSTCTLSNWRLCRVLFWFFVDEYANYIVMGQHWSILLTLMQVHNYQWLCKLCIGSQIAQLLV